MNGWEGGEGWNKVGWDRAALVTFFLRLFKIFF